MHDAAKQPNNLASSLCSCLEKLFKEKKRVQIVKFCIQLTVKRIVDSAIPSSTTNNHFKLFQQSYRQGYVVRFLPLQNTSVTRFSQLVNGNTVTPLYSEHLYNDYLPTRQFFFDSTVCFLLCLCKSKLRTTYSLQR